MSADDGTEPTEPEATEATEAAPAEPEATEATEAAPAEPEATEATEAAPAEPEEEAPEPDEAREALVARMREELGDDVVDHHVHPGHDVWVRVAPAAWRRAGEVARDELECRYFCFLSAIDWKPSPWGRGEDDPTEPPPERPTEVEQGVTGGDTRFQVLARVVKVPDGLGLNLKCDVPEDTMALDSWTDIYAGADWHERETWEMFGISFAGHPGLRHIYLPTEFEGHPLRKDFPLLARHVKPWPGIVDVEPMPPSPDDDTTDKSAEAPAEEQAAASDAEGGRATDAATEEAS